MTLDEVNRYFQQKLESAEDSLIKHWHSLRNMNRKSMIAELKELALTINKQFFGQIPGVSALTGLAAGAWVASTFTTSSFRGALAHWGLTSGPSIVVSENTYRVLAVAMPVLATAIVMYVVQKLLHAYREWRLASDMRRIDAMNESVRCEVGFCMALLDQAREVKLLSAGEHHTKKCELYQSFAGTGLYRWLDMLLQRFS